MYSGRDELNAAGRAKTKTKQKRAEVTCLETLKAADLARQGGGNTRELAPGCHRVGFGQAQRLWRQTGCLSSCLEVKSIPCSIIQFFFWGGIDGTAHWKSLVRLSPALLRWKSSLAPAYHLLSHPLVFPTALLLPPSQGL